MDDIPFPDTYAHRRPDRVAYWIEPDGVAVTYRDLVDSSIRISGMLRERGIRRGACVALLMDNCAEFLKVAWACQRSGLRYTAIPYRSTSAETAYLLQDSDAVAVFTTSRLAAVCAVAVEQLADRPILLTVDGAVTGFETLDTALAGVPVERSDDEVEGLDLLYSSGTTGRPKGVEAEMTFPALGTPPGVAALLQQRWGFGEDTVYLSPAPLYHAAPLRFCMTVHRFGGTCVVMRAFDPELALELVARHRITHAQMVPTMMIRMLKLEERVRAAHNLSSLGVLIHAAAPCPPEVKQRMIEWLGPVVHEFYSSTENYLFTAITSEESLERPGSVGRPLVGVPHICDADGRELPVGEVGVLWSEGGHDFSYRNDPAKTADSYDSRGWTTVGDLARLDEDGYLYLADRRSDLILRGGVNVYPQEAENVLSMHPSVADVAVFGIPDAVLGERVAARVQLAGGLSGSDRLADELLEYCAHRLARDKCPETLEFAAELPRTPTGKLLRRALRDSYTAAGATLPDRGA